MIKFYLYVDGILRATTRTHTEDGARRVFIAMLPQYPYCDRKRVQVTDTEVARS